MSCALKDYLAKLFKTSNCFKPAENSSFTRSRGSLKKYLYENGFNPFNQPAFNEPDFPMDANRDNITITKNKANINCLAKL